MENKIRELLAEGLTPEDIMKAASTIAENDAKEKKAEAERLKKLDEAKRNLYKAANEYMIIAGIPVDKQSSYEDFSSMWDSVMDRLFLPIFNREQTNTRQPIKVFISEETESNSDDVFETLLTILKSVEEGI